MIKKTLLAVIGPAHCIDCHSPIEQVMNHEGEKDLVMSGGFGLEIPPGKFFAPNITPDQETGIGRYNDGHFVKPQLNYGHPNQVQDLF